MAHKLLAPFKKFPQQLPIFKKSSDKWKDISLSNYNSVYGMLDDVTAQSFDEKLHLLAVGTKRGEIKIYGSAGICYTLVGIAIKSITFLRFLQGQGRLISVTTDNEILLWEYKIDASIWEITSTLSLNTLLPNLSITSLDVSHTLLWKSQDDNLLHLLLIGLNNNSIRQVLIIGNRLHLYDGDDTTVDSDEILLRCSDLSKEYEFGEIMSLKFNSTSSDRFLVAFTNGLILLMKSNALEPNSIVEETEAPKEEQIDVKIEKVDEVKEQSNETVKPETEEHQNGESKDGKVDEEKEKVEGAAEKSEPEKPKPSEDTQKPDEVKVQVKKIKESLQVPSASVKLPQIINYIVSDKKINAVCWCNDDIAVNYQESNEICLYRENEEGGKLTESHNNMSLPDGINHPISNVNCFKQGEIDMLTFVTKTEGHPNLLCLMTAGHIAAEFETASNIIDYVIVKDHQVTDDTGSHVAAHARTLLVLCESQLVAIDLTSEHYSELQCPYLVRRAHSQVTAITSIIQVPGSMFPNRKTLHELFENWPLNTPVTCNDVTSDEILDILATGHSDGAINIWQVMSSGVASPLASINNTDIFRNLPPQSHSISEVTLPRRRVGHHLINNEDSLLRINNIQLLHNSADDSSDSVGNGLFCVAGNSSGTVFVLKYDRSEVGINLTEITSNLKELHEKEDIVWNDSDAPELLDRAEISGHVPNLSHIIQLNPSLPVTSLAFQSQWNILAVGCTYGLVLVDLKQNDTVFSYSTLARASKSVAQVPLTVGQQLRKSMRLSFRKLKKFKPNAKHTNDDKNKEKTEVKPDDTKPEETKPDEVKSDESKLEDEEKNHADGDKKSDHGETVPEKADAEEKEKTEDSVKTGSEVPAESQDTENEPPIEISRKDKPPGTVGSLLIEATNLVSAIKEPCLFAGTNMGAIYAFELKFNLDGPITATLLKELHLQHKAPVILLGIVNSSHVPLVGTNEVSTYQRKSSTIEEKTEDVLDAVAPEPEADVVPSDDAENEEAKLKAGTLPAPHKVNDEEVEKTEPVRKSIDAGKEKVASSSTSMKKSGTLPASFLQAIGKSPANADAHELLVVSEEQVKLFSLPTLKAKYKYKVVDTGHHFGHTKSSGSQENEDKKAENTDSSNADVNTTKKPSRRIASVGLCKVQGTKQNSTKWGVSISLTNGELVALTLNNLKKYLSNLYNGSSPVLSSITNGELNLVVSLASDQNNMQVTDFSQNGVHHFEPTKAILIPESARPVIKAEEKGEPSTKAEEPTEETKTDTDKVDNVENGQSSEHMNGHAEANEVEEGKDQMGEEALVQNPSTTHHGDITMDSIKEYITNMDGNITVKTFESSTEKHITVNDGKIVTTVHEKQTNDGDIIKDETVKITSDTVGTNAISSNE